MGHKKNKRASIHRGKKESKKGTVIMATMKPFGRFKSSAQNEKKGNSLEFFSLFLFLQGHTKIQWLGI